MAYTIICDERRHIAVEPFSLEALHEAAATLGVKRCWFHAGRFPHYDMPKKRIEELKPKCKLVSSRELLEVIKRGQA